MIKSVLRMSASLVAAAFVSASVTPAVAQNLVTNPGFESAISLEGFTVDRCEAGLGAFRSGIFQRTGSFGLAFNSRGCNATVTQSISTIAGQQYSVSLFARATNVNTNNNLTFSFGGVELFNQTLTNTVFQQFTFTTTATTSSSDLVIGGRSVASNAVDDVSVTAVASTVVPEPATVVLMGSGLFAVFAAGYRRRNTRA